MSAEVATLLRLYRQSRYLKRRPGEGPEDLPEPERQQRERWAVAALGHVLHHDDKFCRAFWDRLCARDGELPPSEVIVHVEPRHEADLLLVGMGSKEICAAIEVKIGAGLKPRQNPKEPEFWKRGGYGRDLRDRCRREKQSPRYVVLGHREELDLRPERRRGIWLRQYDWSRLLEIPRRQRGLLVRDLYATLAELGVTDMAIEELKDVRVDTPVPTAARAWHVLSKVCEHLGFRRTEWYVDYYHPEDEPRQDFGTYLEPRKRGRTRRRPEGLKRATQQKKMPSAWFGYGGEGTGRPRPQVRVYPRTLARARVLENHLRKHGSLKVTSEENRDENPPDGAVVIVSPPKGYRGSDAAFFLNALEKTSDFGTPPKGKKPR